MAMMVIAGIFENKIASSVCKFPPFGDRRGVSSRSFFLPCFTAGLSDGLVIGPRRSQGPAGLPRATRGLYESDTGACDLTRRIDDWGPPSGARSSVANVV